MTKQKRKTNNGSHQTRASQQSGVDQQRVGSRMAKCEDCGGDAFYREWPAGWMQTRGSQWGTKYQKDGIAWHCPACRFRLRDSATGADERPAPAK